MSQQFNDNIIELASQIKDNWTLCEFLGKSEMEYMVAETIHAARINLDAHGEPFSFRGDGVLQASMLFDNAGAYKRLIDEGLFSEEKRVIEGKQRVVIFPTQKLVDKLKSFLETKR